MPNETNQEFRHSREAAAFLGLKPQTLRVWRVRGHGPAYVRMGGRFGRVLYRQVDLDEWVREHTFRSTAEETVAENGIKNAS